MTDHSEAEPTTAEMAERVLAKIIELVDARGKNGGSVMFVSGGDITTEIDGLDQYGVTIKLAAAKEGNDFDDTVAGLYFALCTARGRRWR